MHEMLKLITAISTLTTLAVLILVGLLLYRKRRSLPGRFVPHSATDDLHCQVLEQLVYVLTGLGTRLAEG
jgi:hypothetical protein